MTKTMRILAMLLLFVVFPLVSWYYLKTGAQWRRQNLSELVEVGKMLPVNYTDGAGKTHNQIDKKVCVVYLSADSIETSASCKHAMQVFNEIYDQFNARPELRLVVVSKPGFSAVKELATEQAGGKTETWVYSEEYLAWQSVLQSARTEYAPKANWQISEHFVCLSDINGNIKGVYSVDDKQQVIKLVQHLAILLPLK